MKHMKNKTNWLIAAGFMLIAGTASAQKATETSAALEFRNYKDKLMRQDMEGAKKSLEKAKGFIDAAAAHADTKDSPKTLYYKGEIYSNYFIFGMQAMDTTFIKQIGDDGFDQAVASYKRGYEVSDKFDDDIKQGVGEKKMFLFQFTEVLFTNKLYAEAIELYDMQVKFSSAINEIDTASIFNAGICAENAQQWDKAADYYKRCADLNYRVPEIYKKIAITLINAGKNEEATVFLQKAVEKFPNDEYLYFYIGTMYIDLKDEAKATENLEKAVQLNPKFNEAQYQLGKHYLDIASRLRDEASQLDVKEQKKYDAMIAQSIEYYKKAAGPLEAYVAAVPNEKAVLISLYQIHKALKNTEKALEYKKRADEIR